MPLLSLSTLFCLTGWWHSIISDHTNAVIMELFGRSGRFNQHTDLHTAPKIVSAVFLWANFSTHRRTLSTSPICRVMEQWEIGSGERCGDFFLSSQPAPPSLFRRVWAMQEVKEVPLLGDDTFNSTMWFGRGTGKVTSDKHNLYKHLVSYWYTVLKDKAG